MRLTDVDIQYDDPRPEETQAFQEELNVLFPPVSLLSHLRAVWEPGEAWHPVERYVLYQCLPSERTPNIILNELQGPNPRGFGHYDRVKKKYIRYPDCPFLSRRQWLLYQDTGFYGRPYWVVQGQKGGHQLRFTKTQQMAAKLRGANPEPAKPGELEFAPLDGRVLEKLVPLDRVRKYAMVVDHALQNPDVYDEKEMEGVQKMEEQMWTWLSDQVNDRLMDAGTDATLALAQG